MTTHGPQTPRQRQSPRDSRALIAAHRAQGQEFSAAGVRSFVWEAGSGEAVLCLHGIPASSFLYRKLLPCWRRTSSAASPLTFPGLGLAERAVAFDYTWTGLGEWCAAAVDARALDRFHLVVHDFGGPIGFELCARMPQPSLASAARRDPQVRMTALAGGQCRGDRAGRRWSVAVRAGERARSLELFFFAPGRVQRRCPRAAGASTVDVQGRQPRRSPRWAGAEPAWARWTGVPPPATGELSLAGWQGARAAARHRRGYAADRVGVTVRCPSTARDSRGDVMADPVDLVGAWQDALQQLRRVAAEKLDESTLGEVIAPLQRQAEVFEQAVRRQGEFDAQLGRRLLAPMEGLVEVLERAPAAMRGQAQAFEAAAIAFKQAAEVLDAQATVLERALATMRLPGDLLKSVGARADSQASAKKPGAKKPTRRR